MTPPPAKSPRYGPKADGYISSAGIEEAGCRWPENNHTFALYGAFPMLLEFADADTGNFGLAWLHNMLKGPEMQGPMGAGESGTNDGDHVTHVKTMDCTQLNVLAMAGGLADEMAELLREKGVYEKFMKRAFTKSS